MRKSSADGIQIFAETPASVVLFLKALFSSRIIARFEQFKEIIK